MTDLTKASRRGSSLKGLVTALLRDQSFQFFFELSHSAVGFSIREDHEQDRPIAKLDAGRIESNCGIGPKH